MVQKALAIVNITSYSQVLVKYKSPVQNIFTTYCYPT